jgi:ABC-type uncharacterized transport system substrate-binding protein
MNQKILVSLAVLAILGGGTWWLALKGQEASLSSKGGVRTETGSYAGKKILYVDSYHEGYDWSDELTQGIKSGLQGSGIQLEIVRMDTKRNTDEAFKMDAALRAKKAIETFKPDVLLLSEDNAFKYVVKEYYRDAALPVVFSGLNWDASVYGAPYTNTTGMVEVSLTNQIIDQLKGFARGSRLGYLSADNETERKNLTYYNSLLGITFQKAYFVKDYSAWKEKFKQLQGEVDIVIFENNAGIEGWDEEGAKTFALAETKVPVGTTNPWIMNYALLGITKVAGEQGEWSADAALKILNGATPASIPVVKNKRGNLMVNLSLADKLRVTFAPSVLKNAEVVR